MTTGYIYHHGTLAPIDGVHSDSIGNIDKAIAKGVVRMRLHASGLLAIQGRSKRLVDAALEAFCDHVKIPRCVTLEYPGRYIEFELREYTQ